jgi:hypothetical protein
MNFSRNFQRSVMNCVDFTIYSEIVGHSFGLTHNPVKKVSLFLRNWNASWMSSYRLHSVCYFFSFQFRFFEYRFVFPADQALIPTIKYGKLHWKQQQQKQKPLIEESLVLLCFREKTMIDYVICTVIPKVIITWYHTCHTVGLTGIISYLVF